MRTLRELAQEALAVQDACNLSGVAQSFAKAMADLTELLKDTQKVREHQITNAWVSKISSLTNFDTGSFGSDFLVVHMMARGEWDKSPEKNM